MSQRVRESVMMRIAKKGNHHVFASRDYEDIDCQAVGCMFNSQKKCNVPSQCKIGADGKCEGFRPKPPPKMYDGD